MSSRTYHSAVRFPVVAVGLCSLSYVLVKTGRDSLFFSYRELTDLATAFGLIALLAIPMAWGHLGLMKRLGCRWARLFILIASALFFLGVTGFVSFESVWGAIGLFAVVPVLFSAIFASVWLLAGDLLEGCADQGRAWAYSRIGASALVGGTVGGLVAQLIAALGEPEQCIVAGGGTLLISAGVVQWAHHHYPASMFRESKVESKETVTGLATDALSTGKLVRIPFLGALTAVAVLMALSGQLIDFQFYAFVKLSGATSATFFAEFYTILNGAALLIQLFLAPMIQSRMGVAGSLLILPLGLLGTSWIVAFSSSLLSRSFLKLSEDGLKSAIHRSTWEQAFLALHRKTRAVAKVIVDGMSVRMAEALGAVALYTMLWINQSEYSCLHWLTWALVGIVTIWVGMTLVLIRLGCDPVGDARYQVRLSGS